MWELSRASCRTAVGSISSSSKAKTEVLSSPLRDMGAVKALISDTLATNGCSYRRVFFLTTSSLRHEGGIFGAASGREADLMEVLGLCSLLPCRLCVCDPSRTPP